MQVKYRIVNLVSASCLFLFLPVSAYCSATKCFLCEDVQHAVNLASLEKRLLQSDPQSIEALDKEAQEWFETFQEGGMLFDGWKEISDEVVKQVPDEQKLRTKVTMQALGVRIGCEWSKENDVRKIDTDMLKAWGKELRKTVASSPINISEVISSIEAEVDDLLL